MPVKKTTKRSIKRSNKRSNKRSIKKSDSYSEIHSLDEYEGRKNFINDYFTKIFIINLRDKTARFEKTTKQFHKKGIKYTRFDALDGRCSGEDCRKKKRELSKKHSVKITMSSIPAASLTIGTIEILREMVRNKWPRILICEDDVELTRSVIENFEKGIKEVEKVADDYDVLYLGCGNKCGIRGLSENKTSQNKYLTSLSIVEGAGYDWYVKYKNDIRMPCTEEDGCYKLSSRITLSPEPYGTWGYAYTLEAAKKLLKYIDNKAYAAIDMIVVDAIIDGVIKAISFDPPIIMHEAGAFRPDSDIDWEW